MTGRERVAAAMRGEDADLAPATATLSLYGARLTGCPLPEYFNDPGRYAEGQAAVAAAFDPDILFTPFLATAETEIFGGRARYPPRAAPNMIAPGFATAADFVAGGMPDLDHHPRIDYLRKATRSLVEGSGGRAVAAVFFSPVDLPALAMGIETWLETLLFDEEMAMRAIELASEYFVARSRFFFEDGVDVLALPLVFCNPSIVTRWIAERLAVPALERAFESAGGPIILHHGGSPVNLLASSWCGLPRVAGLVIDARDRFADSRREVGSELVLLGNVDGPTLGSRSAEWCAAQHDRILSDRSGDPHFILATSAADVSWDTPPENIAAFLGRPLGGERREAG
jgi:uroporphyrinogen decarboxylase